MAPSAVRKGSRFITDTPFTPRIVLPFSPHRAKTRLVSVEPVTSRNGNPGIAVEMEVLRWTPADVAVDPHSRHNQRVGKTIRFWQYWGQGQSPDSNRIASEHFSEVTSLTVTLPDKMSRVDIDALVNDLQGELLAREVIGSVWLVSPNNGSFLNCWTIQVPADQS